NKHMHDMKYYHEECIQDVFLAIWYGIDKYDCKKGNFTNWIAAITKYKCIMYKRKYSVLNLNQDIEDIDIRVNNIDIALKEQELKEEVDILLQNLRPEDKKIFMEYYIEDKTVKEIAREMNIKDDNIYNRISRGKKKLRMLFQNK
ncbi:MAG: sigma-70 family RNA polymerase sigma factor, partial [Romboutsia sp.]|uniref:sigma-70 family RNA polymerase sigma factor n=1 Tax=Romboutsia sp. TaxID=1965302 RepID=UPI003F3AE596